MPDIKWGFFNLSLFFPFLSPLGFFQTVSQFEGKMSSLAHVFEHLVPNWQCCFGRLKNLGEVEFRRRKQVSWWGAGIEGRALQPSLIQGQIDKSPNTSPTTETTDQLTFLTLMDRVPLNHERNLLTPSSLCPSLTATKRKLMQTRSCCNSHVEPCFNNSSAGSTGINSFPTLFLSELQCRPSEDF